MPNVITPDRRGLGAPLSAEEIHAQGEHKKSEKRAQEEAAQKPVPPPIPYRVDTTGLSTGDLPKPPVRRVNAPDSSGPQSSLQSARPATKPKPSLPPRLPPRESVTPTQDDPPSYSSATRGTLVASGLNQSALSRLGSAGVSVPGLNIGGPAEAQSTSQGQAENRSASSTSATQKLTLSELQTRFSGLSTKSPVSETATNGGTSFAQKQAALETARSFRKDPSSVSLSDAKATAATANSFRERHGDQVAGGLKSANAFNQKYDVAGKVGGYTGNSSTKEETTSSPSTNDNLDSFSPTEKKRLPPPPPPKPALGTAVDSPSPPPPVPLASKPRQ